MARYKVFIVHPSDWLTDHLSIGDGLVAHGFIQSLADRGHELHVATRTAELNKPYPPNVKLYRIPQIVRCRPLDRLEYMFRVRQLFRQLNREVHFDLAHQMNPVFTGLSLALVGIRIPLVLGTYVPDWPDDPDAVTSRRGLLGWVARKGKRVISAVQQSQAGAVLLTSPAALSRITSRRALGKVHDVQHGIDVERFSPAPQIVRPAADPPKILFFSNLGVKKGVFVLLDAFSRVLEVVPECKLTIAGGGQELGDIQRIVTERGWKKNVDVLGKVPREIGVQLYHTHHVYTLPSFGEPYATTILEAMSCGLPIVSTNANGVPHMVGEGNLLVPPRDSVALAEALLAFVQDPERAARVGQRNREHTVERHEWQAVIGSLERVYEMVIQPERSGTSQIMATPRLVKMSAGGSSPSTGVSL